MLMTAHVKPLLHGNMLMASVREATIAREHVDGSVHVPANIAREHVINMCT